MRRPLLVQSISRRAPSSVALLLAGVLAVGATALAPLLARAVEQQTLRTTLATAPDSELRLTAQATTEGTRQVYRETVVGRLTGIVTSTALDAHYGPAHGSVVTDSRLTAVGPTGTLLSTRLGWFRDGCGVLGIPAGACPAEPGQAALARVDATALGIAVGDDLVVRRPDGAPTAPLRVTALYDVSAAEVDFGTGVTDYTLPSGVSPLATATSPVLVDAAELETTYGDLNQVSQVVRHLDRDSVRVDDEDDVRAAVAGADQAALDGARSDLVLCDVDQVLDQVDASRRTSAVTVGLVAVQLLLVTWVGLGVLVRAVTTARAPEFAVGSLRGLSGWQVARSASGTTVTLLVLALPLGWLAAVGSGDLLAGRLVGPGATVEPGRSPVALAALVAFAGSVVTAVVAARRAARTPVASLLHRSTASDAPGRWSAAVELAVVVVALVTAFQLVRGGELRTEGQSGLGLLAPALIAVGAGVVLARLATVLLRRATRRAPRRTTGLLASRRLAHAPGVLRGAVVLVAGAALAASAFDIGAIAARNRDLRAGQEIGAAEVLTVRLDRGVDLRTAVDAVDPSGRQAMAAAQLTDPLTGVRIVAADTDRYAAVARVDPAWTDLSATAIAARLHPPVADPFVLTGSSLTVDLADVGVVPSDPDDVSDGTVQVLPDDVGVQTETDLVAVVDDGAAWTDVPLGAVTATTQRFTAPVSCTGGCRLVALGLAAPTPKAAFVARMTVTGIGTDPQSVAASAAVLARQDSWVAPALLGSDFYRQSATRVAAGSGGLRLTMTDPVGVPSAGPQVLVATRPARLPVVAGRSFGRFPLSLEAPAVLGSSLDGEPAAYGIEAQSQALPRVGAIGVLVDLRIALAASDPAGRGGVVWQVWLTTPSRAGAVSAALAARGVTVTATETAAGRSAHLAELGPARAVVVAEVAAAAALVLALLVALAGLLAAGRNRLYELASLRAAGVRDRTLRASVVVELAALLGVAAVVGTGVGAGVAGLTTAGLSFYSDGGGPPLDLAPATTGVVALAGVAVLAVGVVAVATAVGLVRAASPVRLRESIR